MTNDTQPGAAGAASDAAARQPLAPDLSTQEPATASILPGGRPSESGPPPAYEPARSGQQAPFVAADHAQDGKKHLLLCASGSVATIKIPSICRALAGSDRLAIRIVLTRSAERFLAGQSAEQPTAASLLDVPNVEAVYLDEDEWRHPWRRGAPILHIELRRWSDICVVAPLSANTLAKMANGLADNLLTSVLRAWDTEDGIENRGRVAGCGGLRKRIVVAPAMNTGMWLHPITDKQIKVLTDEWGVGAKARKGSGWVEVLLPSKKELACGDVGVGAMVSWEEIVKVICGRLWLGSPPIR